MAFRSSPTSAPTIERSSPRRRAHLLAAGVLGLFLAVLVGAGVWGYASRFDGVVQARREHHCWKGYKSWCVTLTLDTDELTMNRKDFPADARVGERVRKRRWEWGG